MFCCAMFCCAINVFAQSVQQEPDPAAIIELGGAASRGLNGGRSSFGGDLAVEFTPIEKWLEIEAGTTRSSAVTQQNGIPAFYSKSLGPSQEKSNLCSASAPSGYTRARMA
jgi:hypothetical protein